MWANELPRLSAQVGGLALAAGASGEDRAMDVETEIAELKRRVGELEGSQDVLFSHVRAAHRGVLTLQGRADQRFDRLELRIDKVDVDMQALRVELPAIVGDAVRSVIEKKE